MRIHLALGAVAALVPLTVVAQTPPPAPAPAPAPQKNWRDLITVEGLVDAYGAVRAGGDATVSTAYRVFDAPTDTFAFAFAKLAVGIKPEPVGLRLDLGFGPVADATASSPGVEMWKHVLQGYGSFVLSTSVPLTLDVGKFVTAAGAEVIEAHANWNYSRSFLFGYAIPFTHTGLRVTAPIGSAMTLQAMAVNGWDNSFDNNLGKTLGLSLTFSGLPNTTLIANAMAGPEPGPAGSDWRLLLDLVASLTVGNLSLNFNADFGHQGDFTWLGLAAYLRLALGQAANLSLRGEVFSDRQGFRLAVMGGAVTVGEVTATLGFPVGGNGEFRLEGRGDFASRDIFAFAPGGMDERSSQFTVTGAALVWF